MRSDKHLSSTVMRRGSLRALHDVPPVMRLAKRALKFSHGLAWQAARQATRWPMRLPSQHPPLKKPPLCQ